eukprot:593382_1
MWCSVSSPFLSYFRRFFWHKYTGIHDESTINSTQYLVFHRGWSGSILVVLWINLFGCIGSFVFMYKQLKQDRYQRVVWMHCWHNSILATIPRSNHTLLAQSIWYQHDLLPQFKNPPRPPRPLHSTSNSLPIPPFNLG